MNIEELIDTLARDVAARPRASAWRTLPWAVAGGALIALLLAVVALHVHPALGQEALQPMFWVREGYCALLGVLGCVLLGSLGRPGARPGAALAGIPAAVLLMWALALTSLVKSPAAARGALILGSTAAACPLLITLLASPIFVALTWALRGRAPTQLRLTGTALGFAAGALGALVYTVHCPELAAPFLAVWYLLGMLIPAAVGGWAGPRLLRW